MPLGDVKIDIPPESLTTPQRLNIEGREVTLDLDPLVTPLDVTLSGPTPHDLIADATRLANACTAQRVTPVVFASDVLRELSPRLREQEWQARVAIRRPDGDGQGRREIVGVLRSASPLRVSRSTSGPPSWLRTWSTWLRGRRSRRPVR